MTDDPKPNDDEDWTLNDDENHEEPNNPQAGESLEDAGESLEEAGEALEDEDETYDGGDAGGRFDNVREQVTKRDFLKGVGAGAVGIGVLALAGDYISDEVDLGQAGPGADGDDSVYQLSDEVSVDLDSLDPIYEDSSVTMGIQADGDLIAWNTNVQNSEGQNPLWRFSSDEFPDPQQYDIEGEHPISELYSASDAPVDSMTEDMVNVFYDGDDWESESNYKEIGFDELKDGLLEYGNLGQAQDYFFNRQESLDNGDPVLEREWQQLLQDGR